MELPNCYKVVDKVEYINYMTYNNYYCKLDVITMKKGFLKFRDDIHKITGLDCFDYLTISSLTHNYMISEGVYDGVYENTSILRDYLQNFIVGGRVMTRNNEKLHCKKILDDFDGVSLYPSSINRLSEELGGILKGKPEILKPEELNIDFLNSVSGYFITIKILKVNKRYNFPLLSKQTKTTREFTNDMVGEIVYCDKVYFEDLIKFHKIEYEILQGIYYNNGRNPTFGKIISKLFNERIFYKEQKNNIQLTLKLMMNSSYGKTIQKRTNTQIKFYKKYINDKTTNEYIENKKFLTYQYNMIKEVLPLKNLYKTVLYDKNDNYYSMGQVGCEILTMSKRIMNEVICLGEDLGIYITYTDTDSIHMEKEKIPLLIEEYKRVYGKKLNGDDMGQFNCDFEFNGCKNIQSIESYFLGKKSYIDLLEGDYKKNGRKYKYHIRMKGVGTKVINYYCYKNDIEPIEVYKGLYEGKTYKFDLTCGGCKLSVNHLNYEKIKSRINFDREVNF